MLWVVVATFDSVENPVLIQAVAVLAVDELASAGLASAAAAAAASFFRFCFSSYSFLTLSTSSGGTTGGVVAGELAIGEDGVELAIGRANWSNAAEHVNPQLLGRPLGRMWYSLLDQPSENCTCTTNQ